MGKVPFEMLRMRVACRLHFEGQQPQHFGHLCSIPAFVSSSLKKKRVKRRPGLLLLNMRPQKPGQGSSPNLMGKKNTRLVAKMKVDYISS